MFSAIILSQRGYPTLLLKIIGTLLVGPSRSSRTKIRSFAFFKNYGR